MCTPAPVSAGQQLSGKAEEGSYNIFERVCNSIFFSRKFASLGCRKCEDEKKRKHTGGQAARPRPTGTWHGISLPGRQDSTTPGRSLAAAATQAGSGCQRPRLRPTGVWQNSGASDQEPRARDEENAVVIAEEVCWRSKRKRTVMLRESGQMEIFACMQNFDRSWHCAGEWENGGCACLRMQMK